MARPSTPKLSREKIARAALEIIDAEGDFTISQVASALSVRPSSLYNHVSGRTEVIELIRDATTEGMTVADPSEPWQSGLAAMLRWYRDMLALHPRLIPLLTAQTVKATSVSEFYNSMATALRTAGFSDDTLLDAITTVDVWALGSAFDLAAPEDVWDLETFPDGPMHDALAAAPSGRERADQSFELGLRVLIAGLTAVADQQV